MASIPLLPKDQRAGIELEIIAVDNSRSGLPGLATLIPPLQIKTRAEVGRIERVMRAYSVEIPVFRFGYAAALMLFFAIAWLVGIRYLDVVWMIVVTAVLLFNAWTNFTPSADQSLWYTHQIAISAFALYGAMAIFVAAFLRIEFDRHKVATLYLLSMGAISGIILSLDRRIVLEYYLENRVPMTIVITALASGAYLTLVKKRDVPHARRRKIMAFGWISAIGALCYVAEMVLMETKGVSLQDPVNYSIVTIFAGFLASDLVTFHRNYFTERKQREHSESERRVIVQSLEVGQMVQTLLMPEELKGEIGPYRFLMHHAPFSHMSGDWLRRSNVDKSRVALWQGDVVGKGPAAALGVTAIMSALDDNDDGLKDPPAGMARIDSTLRRLFRHHINSTAAVVTLGENGRVELYSCGTIGWFLWHEGVFQHLPVRGSLLGSEGELSVGHRSADIPPGGMLFTFTDGVMEGSRAIYALKSILSKKSTIDGPAELTKVLLETGQGHAQPDDRTLTIVQRVE
jgi:hypothetical protein